MKLIKYLMVLILFVSLSGNSTCGTDNSNAALLFVQNTDAGTWVDNGDGTHTLNLTSPAPTVTSFTDRPERIASTLTIEEFLDQWASYGFDTTPPNAAIVIDDAPDGEKTIVVTLSDPQIVGDSFQYTATVVLDPTNTFSNYDADTDIQETFTGASLFIDGANATVVLKIDLLFSDVPENGEILLNISTPSTATWSVVSGFNFESLNPNMSSPIFEMGILGSSLCVFTGTGDTSTFDMSLEITLDSRVPRIVLDHSLPPGSSVTVTVNERTAPVITTNGSTSISTGL